MFTMTTLRGHELNLLGLQMLLPSSVYSSTGHVHRLFVHSAPDILHSLLAVHPAPWSFSVKHIIVTMRTVHAI